MHRTAAQLGVSAVGSLAIAGLLWAFVATAADGSEVDSQAALNEGNRLFRDGKLEEAVAAYELGYSPTEPHPTLLYNLGTALHHLDRLPEAILWYRRADDSDDPWLEENLWLARRSLGSQILPATGSLGWLSRHTGGLRLTAIAFAWMTLLLVFLSPKAPPWTWILISLSTLSLYGGASAVDRWGPRPAVVLSDCSTPAGDLPAGTEAWVRATAEGQWAVVGSEQVVCSPDSVELIFPET